MIIKSQVLGLGIKIIGLAVFAAVLCFGNVGMIIQSSYAQFSEQLEGQQQEQATGEEQVASDGGLTATINGETFGKGDTISVTGTVEERDGSASMYATIIDPDGIELGTDSINVGSDMTFRYGFVAGEGTSDMTKAGTYTIQIQYFPPGNADIESVSLDFEYNPETPPAAQTEQGIGTEGTTTEPTTTFQSNVDGLRMGVPDGWIVDDDNNTDPQNQQLEQSLGSMRLMKLCRQDQATPVIGGNYSCPTSGVESVSIYRYGDLQKRPEFADVVRQDKNITVSDFLAYLLQSLERDFGHTENRLLKNIDGTVNITDIEINQTAGTAPAKYVEYTYLNRDGARIERDFAFLVLSPNGSTGYVLFPVAHVTEEDLPQEIQEILDSFELLTNSSQLQHCIGCAPQSQQNSTTTTTTPFPSNSTTGTSNSTTSNAANKFSLTPITPQSQPLL